MHVHARRYVGCICRSICCRICPTFENTYFTHRVSKLPLEADLWYFCSVKNITFDGNFDCSADQEAKSDKETDF